MMFGKYARYNRYNVEGGRDVKNTDKSQYNCGGYALGIFNWYCPYGEQERGIELFEEKILSVEELTTELVEFMLNDFEDLRVIEKVEDLKENEYAIAFKVGEDDFHFARRAKNGAWFHKRGGVPKIERMRKEQVFADVWYNETVNYTSKTILLAKEN